MYIYIYTRTRPSKSQVRKLFRMGGSLSPEIHAEPWDNCQVRGPPQVVLLKWSSSSGPP